MNAYLQSIDPRDLLHFRGILARFGLEADKHVNGGLHVPAHGTFQTADSSHGGFKIVLSTGDIDQYKHWIGAPDHVHDDCNPWKHPLPRNTVACNRSSLAALSNEERDDLHHAGRAYIWGPSQLVKHHKEALEHYFAPLTTTVHVFTTLDVKGKLLINDPTPSSAVLANTINFHPGGTIEGTNNLSIQSTYIFKLNT